MVDPLYPFLHGGCIDENVQGAAHIFSDSVRTPSYEYGGTFHGQPPYGPAHSLKLLVRLKHLAIILQASRKHGNVVEQAFASCFILFPESARV